MNVVDTSLLTGAQERKRMTECCVRFSITFVDVQRHLWRKTSSKALAKRCFSLIVLSLCFALLLLLPAVKEEKEYKYDSYV